MAMLDVIEMRIARDRDGMLCAHDEGFFDGYKTNIRLRSDEKMKDEDLWKLIELARAVPCLEQPVMENAWEEP